jgi:hypothetical protein
VDIHHHVDGTHRFEIAPKKHFTVLLLAHIPTEAVRSPCWWRSGCQQWSLPAPSSRKPKAQATSAMGTFRLMKRMSGMTSFRGIGVAYKA